MADTLGGRIKAARKAKKWLQNTLAAKAGLSPSTLSDIELNKLDPKFSQVAALCLALDIDMNHAWGYQGLLVEAAVDDAPELAASWLKYKQLPYEYQKRLMGELDFLLDLHDLVEGLKKDN